MLQTAMEEKYAVGAFNILDYNSMKSVVLGAEEKKAPVIVQTSVKTVLFWGYDTVFSWYKELAESVSVPVAMHLDHCKDIEVIKNCIEAGWTSVMIDASSKPYNENLYLSKHVVEMARPRGISVEAELGSIVGVEDDIHVKEQDAHLADIEQSIEFCSIVKPDCFAPAIGTAHGLYKGEPKIAFDRIDEISKITGIPLALHGGTGLSEDVFKKSIRLGCSKVNISTQLKHTFIDSFNEYHSENPEEYNPLKVLQAQFNSLKKDVVQNINLFGSSSKV
jgi:ketose-bisphosphate aldolase